MRMRKKRLDDTVLLPSVAIVSITEENDGNRANLAKIVFLGFIEMVMRKIN